MAASLSTWKLDREQQERVKVGRATRRMVLPWAMRFRGVAATLLGLACLVPPTACGDSEENGGSLQAPPGEGPVEAGPAQPRDDASMGIIPPLTRDAAGAPPGDAGSVRRDASPPGPRDATAPDASVTPRDAASPALDATTVIDGDATDAGPGDPPACVPSPTECALGLVRTEMGETWICYDPSDPQTRTGDMRRTFPTGLMLRTCPDPVHHLMPCFRPGGGACTLARGSCELSDACACEVSDDLPTCDCTPAQVECRDSPKFGCQDEGEVLFECGTDSALCGGSYYDTGAVGSPSECSTDADCVPEPCGYPAVCVSRTETECRRPSTCEPEGLCHVPIESCRCSGGQCQATYGQGCAAPPRVGDAEAPPFTCAMAPDVYSCQARAGCVWGAGGGREACYVACRADEECGGGQVCDLIDAYAPCELLDECPRGDCMDLRAVCLPDSVREVTCADWTAIGDAGGTLEVCSVFHHPGDCAAGVIQLGCLVAPDGTTYRMRQIMIYQRGGVEVLVPAGFRYSGDNYVAPTLTAQEIADCRAAP